MLGAANESKGKAKSKAAKGALAAAFCMGATGRRLGHSRSRGRSSGGSKSEADEDHDEMPRRKRRVPAGSLAGLKERMAHRLNSGEDDLLAVSAAGNMSSEKFNVLAAEQNKENAAQHQIVNQHREAEIEVARESVKVAREALRAREVEVAERLAFDREVIREQGELRRLELQKDSEHQSLLDIKHTQLARNQLDLGGRFDNLTQTVVDLKVSLSKWGDIMAVVADKIGGSGGLAG